ncbi:POT family proton-dependent oligopeptide transporter [Nocardioides cavernae]|uniref:POT family proton-dependent oligopeptide transporter n=1 Tax=Nocardioides cavernae TaxID=1921566 RepID=A0A7Y9H7W9_9ACTN|nr:peptide MFS transporter [Nocardioides cavernae]NYE38964.1 POT family proton-dependent oligopeptide transporter [Nocardioides cavernae]
MSAHQSSPHQKTRDTRSDTGFLGQPAVLANLFGVELWERFSFYGMQGILLIYLYFTAAEGGLGIDQGVATSIVGAYGGAVYLSTILGAWLADRLIGPERTLFYAAVCVMLGHVALSLLPGLTGVGVGLVLIALGSGGVKANATSLVGSLYDEHDTRRDAGFSLFYMGINIGAFIGPLLTGLLQDSIGFHWGFGAAAVGMALGLAQYTIFRGRLPEETHHVANPLPAGRGRAYAVGGVVAVALVAVLVRVGVITAERLSDIVIGISLLAAIAYFVLILADKQVQGVERSRVLAFIPLFVCNVVFWALYQQQFTVVPIYADERLDRDLFGWEMPIAWVNSINPVFIIVLAGVFAALWTKLGSRQPATPLKFGAGTALMGVAFFLFLGMPAGSNTAPLLGIVGILLVFTLAELLISPVGLSATTKLAPKKFATQMVGLYFLSIALGTALAGTLAGYYDQDAEGPFFIWVGLAAVVTGVVVMIANKPIHRLMAGVD